MESTKSPIESWLELQNMGDSKQSAYDRITTQPFMLLSLGIFFVGVVNLITVSSPLIRSLPPVFGIYTPILINIILPSTIVVFIYPIAGVPAVENVFSHPFSYRAVFVQCLFGLFVLPVLIVVVEISIINLSQMIISLITVPIVEKTVANIGMLEDSWSFLYLMYATILSSALGAWGALLFYWVMQKINLGVVVR